MISGLSNIRFSGFSSFRFFSVKLWLAILPQEKKLYPNFHFYFLGRLPNWRVVGVTWTEPEQINQNIIRKTLIEHGSFDAANLIKRTAWRPSKSVRKKVPFEVQKWMQKCCQNRPQNGSQIDTKTSPQLTPKLVPKWSPWKTAWKKSEKLFTFKIRKPGHIFFHFFFTRFSTAFFTATILGSIWGPLWWRFGIDLGIHFGIDFDHISGSILVCILGLIWVSF